MSRREVIERHFPGLADTDYEITSPTSTEYNCIAWAAEDDSRWWEPDPAFIYFWPSMVLREYTIDSYLQAYTSLGYQLTDDESFTQGVDKVALFAKDGRPQHAARQLSNGMWTSKCGQLEDIAHPLRALEGDEYGRVEFILARQSVEG